MKDTEIQAENVRDRWTAVLEIGLILLLFFLFAGWLPPNVNEAHYLAKAKHYWQPQWCAGDHFLESADAHLVFYWTFGWLTLFLPLPAVAWMGRFVTWTLMAWSWRRLSYAAIPKPFASLLTVSLFLFFSGHFQMAGEWVVGGVEAKGIAYALVFFALERMLGSHWRTVWLLLGLATSFHVLVGGWSLIAAGAAWFSCGNLRPCLRSMLPSMVLGALLALPGLLPALALNGDASADEIHQANMIYVYYRLPHHLVFHRFSHRLMARCALLLIAWLAACYATPCRLREGVLGQRPLRGFVGGAVAIALIGILIDQSLLYHLDVAAKLLKYYWYRLADAALPIGASIAFVAWAVNLQTRRPRTAQWILVALTLIAGSNLAITNYQHRVNLRPPSQIQPPNEQLLSPVQTRRAFEQWQQVCNWVAQHTDPHACFITPRAQQTFKWYAGRSEVCSWKDVPQNAVSVVQWWQRQQELYPRRVVHNGLSALGEQRLTELAHKYGADFIIIDRNTSHRPLLLPRVYPNDFEVAQPIYEVYQVPPAAWGGGMP